MDTNIIDVTPELAAKWLEGRPTNRVLNRTQIKQLAADLLAGRWLTTHQGILLGKGGILLDGQHRLSAIVRAGRSARMMVSTEETFETVLGLPIDVGNKRNTAFLLGLHPFVASAANLAGEFLLGRKPGHGEILGWTDDIKSALDILVPEGSRRSAKKFSSAPVLLAGCIHILGGNETQKQYCPPVYQALARNDPAALPPGPYSFYRQLVSSPNYYPRNSMFARAYRMFDYSRKDVTKLMIKDEASALSEAVDALNKVLTP